MTRTIGKLSVFTAFTIVVTVWLASIIGNFSLFADTYEIEAAFGDATGILKGDPVKVAGVDVGKVTGFEVEDGRAIVKLQISGEVDLPENVIADMKFRNLLGQRMVILERPDSPSSAKLEEGGRIPVENTRPPLDLSVVFNNLRPLIRSTNPEEINTVARAVVEVFEGREDDFAGILGNLGEVSGTLNDREGRLGRLVTDLDRVAKLLNRKSGSIRKGLGEFGDFMAALEDFTPTIESAVVEVDEASRRFGRILRTNRSNLDQEFADLATVLGVVDENLAPLARVSRNLKEVLLATARSQSYGRWWNLYVVNYCPEIGEPECVGLP